MSVCVVIHSPLYIEDQMVERVAEYKYLGTVLDNQFKFGPNLKCIYKKVCSRVYFIRQLRKLNVDRNILDLFYSSIIASVMSFSISCWFGNSSAVSQRHLNRTITTCTKLGVSVTKSLYELYKKSAEQRCEAILKDNDHPLKCKYTRMRSDRRWRSIKCRTARYNLSFVPASVRLLNE